MGGCTGGLAGRWFRGGKLGTRHRISSVSSTLELHAPTATWEGFQFLAARRSPLARQYRYRVNGTQLTGPDAGQGLITQPQRNPAPTLAKGWQPSPVSRFTIHPRQHTQPHLVQRHVGVDEEVVRGGGAQLVGGGVALRVERRAAPARHTAHVRHVCTTSRVRRERSAPAPSLLKSGRPAGRPIPERPPSRGYASRERRPIWVPALHLYAASRPVWGRPQRPMRCRDMAG